MARLLSYTLGPARGAILNNSTTKKRPEMLNDAATVARRVVAIPDRRQDVGAMMLRQMVWRIHSRVGDGAATAAVLAQAILHEASRMVAAGANVVLVQQGIEEATAVAVAALRHMAQPASSQEDLAAVAQAVTGHPDLSWVLGEMFGLLGRHAHITVENYMAPYLERVYLEGGRWSGRNISPYLVTAPGTQRAIQSDCRVALYDGVLKEMDSLKPLLALIAAESPPHLLLVASDISGEAINLLVGTHRHPQNKLRIVAVSLSLGGDQGLVELNDLALLTGATVLGESVGRPLEAITAADLGRAKRAEAGKDDLFVIKGGGDSRSVRQAIVALQSQLQQTEPDDENRADLQRRLARLSGSVGILKIGALSKPERDVLRQKAEQAIKSLAATLDEGVVVGGGMAFALAGEQVDISTAADADVAMGMLAVKKALTAPFFRILENAAIPAPAVALHETLQAGPGYVYDVMQHRQRDARQAGVMDAAKVARVVLEAAASEAKMALSVDVTVLKKKPRTNVSYEP